MDAKNAITGKVAATSASFRRMNPRGSSTLKRSAGSQSFWPGLLNKGVEDSAECVSAMTRDLFRRRESRFVASFRVREDVSEAELMVTKR